MMIVHKYQIDLTEQQQVVMHPLHKPLHFALQGHDLRLWAVVDEIADTEVYDFRIFGTGQVSSDFEGVLETHFYVGTVQMGNFVWHGFLSKSPIAQKKVGEM